MRVFEESFTGFPALVSTRIGHSRRLFKALVLVVCLGGFLYQSSEFLGVYHEYPTTLDMRVEKPDSIALPAITFCNMNGVRRTAMCTLEPNKCNLTLPLSKFCTRFPRYCIQNEDKMAALPIRGYNEDPDYSLAYLNAVGQRKEDLVTRCKIYNNRVLDCKDNFVSVPVVDPSGLPNTCFTLESLWGQPDARPRRIPVTGKLRVNLNLHPEEYLDPVGPVKGYVMMHDPRAQVNPINDGMTLMSGKFYYIYVSQTSTERQPAPYRTNCTDYLKLWRENGGRGPLSKQSCTENCRMERMLQSVGCAPYSVSYPNNYTICKRSEGPTAPSVEIMEGCSRECTDACTDATYHLRVEEATELSEECEAGDKNCRKLAHHVIMLEFFFNRFEVTTFVHEPKFESVEIFSYIGGYVGMWLGVSLVALFDFAETLFNLLVINPLSQSSKKETQVV